MDRDCSTVIMNRESKDVLYKKWSGGWGQDGVENVLKIWIKIFMNDEFIYMAGYSSPNSS